MGVRREDLPRLEPASRDEWRSWLESNHQRSRGVWLAVGKKGRTRTTLTYEQAVEEALAYGWIDSTASRLDEDRFLQLMTPRRQGSEWAASNKERVARLLDQGRMAPAGIAVVEAAQADGSWAALDDVENLVIPSRPTCGV